jgi:hypothetical protein
VQPTDGDLLLVFSDRDCKDRKPYSPGSGHRKPALAGRLKLTNSAILPVRTIGSPNFGFWAAIVLSVALAIASTPVLAEIQVRGNPEAVTIEARDTSIEEALAALSRAFDMDYQSSVDLDKRLYGTYVGSLSRVVTRILQGYNFVLKTDNGSIAVTVVGTPNASRANPAPHALPAPGDPRAPAPEPRQSGALAPAPSALGSATMPTPEPRSSTGVSAPVVGPKPPLAPPRGL